MTISQRCKVHVIAGRRRGRRHAPAPFHEVALRAARRSVGPAIPRTRERAFSNACRRIAQFAHRGALGAGPSWHAGRSGRRASGAGRRRFALHFSGARGRRRCVVVDGARVALSLARRPVGPARGLVCERTKSDACRRILSVTLRGGLLGGPSWHARRSGVGRQREVSMGWAWWSSTPAGPRARAREVSRRPSGQHDRGAMTKFGLAPEITR